MRGVAEVFLPGIELPGARGECTVKFANWSMCLRPVPFFSTCSRLFAPLASRAAGVGHRGLACVRSAALRLPALGLLPSLAIGVGQRRRISVRLPPLERSPEQARGVGQVVAFPLGKDEQPLALVGRADFRRREEARRKAVAQSDQASGDLGKAEAEMMGDILEEDEGRLTFPDDAGDMWPEVAGVVRALPLARQTERLARVARSEDVHRATPRAAVECGNVVPERRLRQGLVFHPRHEDGRGIGVPLDMTHSAVSGTGDVQSKLEPSGAGAEREAEEAGAVCSGR